MDELSVSQLAGRAGVLCEDVERLVQLGILVPGEGERPFTSGDVRRVRLASACAEAGLPLEGIGAAMAAGFAPPEPDDWSVRTTSTSSRPSRRPLPPASTRTPPSGPCGSSGTAYGGSPRPRTICSTPGSSFLCCGRA